MLLSVVTFKTANGEYQQRVKLRSTYKSLSKSDHDGFQNLMIGKLGGNQEEGRIIEHNYKLETIDGNKVVIDNVTGLMWHQSGSGGFGSSWQQAEEWVGKLNDKGYAGFHNWRLPTLEEAASLLRPTKDSGGLYIDKLFASTQKYLWTGDIYKKKTAGLLILTREM